MPRDLPFMELRGLLGQNLMPINEYAERIGRSTDYVSKRLNAKRTWDIEDVYATLKLFGKEATDIPDLFPSGGYKPKRRGRPPKKVVS